MIENLEINKQIALGATKGTGKTSFKSLDVDALLAGNRSSSSPFTTNDNDICIYIYAVCMNAI